MDAMVKKKEQVVIVDHSFFYQKAKSLLTICKLTGFFVSKFISYEVGKVKQPGAINNEWL